MAVVTDIYITVSLCVIFRSSQASFKATQTLLNQLTVYAINRGTLTATIQFLHFATYLATYRHFSFIWMVFHIPGSKVYVNAVLAALNIRCKLRDLGSLSDQSSLRFVDSEDFSSQFLALQPLPSSQSVTASATV
ncbi:hypothetical protein OBBRIDRAFT_544744 [Obba rivulosa]|uniref:DUF6534 domain-containing protein n=1 Tax=Obba rivulosa TaxID=1052685 RepID=A0A8E2DL69_9APHY|nr:hypothetical protein OBBRIDRAFT_544744 [Obba rivulosa]